MPNRPESSAVLVRHGFFGLLLFVLGTAAQLQQARLSAVWVYGALLAFSLCLAASLAMLQMRRGVQVIALLLCSGIFGFAVTGLRASHFQAQSLSPDWQGRDILVTGVVAAMVQRNESGLRFRLDVESARDGKVDVQLPPRIYLSWYGGVATGMAGADLQRQPMDLIAGERWQFMARLKVPHGASNPHGFDFELWLWEQGLQATGYVRAGPKDSPPQRLAQTWAHPVERLRQHVRDAIFERVPDRKLAGVIAALVVGDQSAIDRADWDIFRATGVAHLMSISGLHVTMFAWLAAALVGWLWRRSARLCLVCPAPTVAVAGGVLLAFAYSVFSGGGLPAQRTVLMLATVGLLRISGKRWPWPQTWMLACAVVVLFDPWALMQAGFWLSFVAVGILFATGSESTGGTQTDSSWTAEPPLTDAVVTNGAHPMNQAIRSFRMLLARVAKSVAATFKEQWVITLALTPLTLLLFGQVSVVGLLANAVAIPWVTLIITPLALLGTVAAPFWDITAWAVKGLAGYLQALASLPFATISMAQAPLWAGIAGLTGGILIAMRLPWFVRLQGLPLLLPLLLWQVPRPELGHFDVLAADIGQGNAVIVRTANHALVYDAGPRFSLESDAGHRVVVPLLRALDLQVDTVVLSHRDADHTGGAQAVLAMQPQAQLLSSIEDGHVLQTTRKATRCVAGQHWQWDGVDFDVLQPYAIDYEQPNRSNAMSCLLRISNGRQVALLAGDIEQAQEARLVAAGAPLKADLLLVPHHGSKTSSSAGFLDAVQPRHALVQAGYRNRFGHPAQVVMDRYKERGIAIFESPQCGAMTWNSAQPEAIRCQRQEAQRYWHHDLRVNASGQ